MSTAANTQRCFSEFIGQRVIGVIFNALPVARRDIAAGTKTIVFEDGRGLTISSTGSYWIDSADDVRRATDAKARELETVAREIKSVLDLAGATP